MEKSASGEHSVAIPSILGGLGGEGSDSGGTLGSSKLESSLITFFSIGIGIPILLLVLIYIIAVFYKVSYKQDNLMHSLLCTCSCR